MTSDREIALLIWRAAVAAERGDQIAAAEILELAAQLLREKWGEHTRTTPAGHRR